MALAMAVPFRLWLGGQISPKRDLDLITRLVQIVRCCAQRLDILVCVDGLSSYVTAFLRVFRNPVHTGRPGRPWLVLQKRLLLGQVVKEYAQRHVTGITRRIVQGTEKAVSALLKQTKGGLDINTVYIERLNATFRVALACLVRRGRALAHQEETLTAGMYLVGCVYNFCWVHKSLRLLAPPIGRPQVATANACDGCGADGLLLDDAGTTQLSSPLASLGDALNVEAVHLRTSINPSRRQQRNHD